MPSEDITFMNYCGSYKYHDKLNVPHGFALLSLCGKSRKACVTCSKKFKYEECWNSQIKKEKSNVE